MVKDLRDSKITATFMEGQVVGIDVCATGRDVLRTIVMLFASMPIEERNELVEFLNNSKDIENQDDLFKKYYLENEMSLGPIDVLKKLGNLINDFVNEVEKE